MRLLYIDGQKVDIDAKTSIGIDIQSYDFKSPGKRKFNVSNSFSIPLTSNNQSIIGFANDPQSSNIQIYKNFKIDYYLDNHQLITKGKVRIERITFDRIVLFVHSKNDFWELIKAFKYSNFLLEYAYFLNTEKNVNINIGNTFNNFQGFFNEFIEEYTGINENLIIPMYYSNLRASEKSDLTGTEDISKIDVRSKDVAENIDMKGGHVCSFIKPIFEFLQFKYGIDFLINSEDPSIIWNDPFIKSVYIPFRDITPARFGTGGDTWSFIILPNQIEDEATAITKINFDPYDIEDKGDKTVFDLVNVILQTFNIIIDEDSENNIFELRRFDQLKDLAEVIDFSNGFDNKKFELEPKIQGFAQENIIKYGSMNPEGSELDGSKSITSKNQSLDETTELFAIDSYFPAVIRDIASDQYIINLSNEESFETFCLLISDGNIASPVNVRYIDQFGQENATVILQKSAVYGIQNEYTFWDEILEYPKFYKAEKWLSIFWVNKLKFFKQYYIKELNGAFFINKISGFNPDKSKMPTKLELVRIGNRTPLPIGNFEESVYVDGVGNPFTDGLGNSFF